MVSSTSRTEIRKKKAPDIPKSTKVLVLEITNMKSTSGPQRVRAKFVKKRILISLTGAGEECFLWLLLCLAEYQPTSAVSVPEERVQSLPKKRLTNEKQSELEVSVRFSHVE